MAAATAAQFLVSGVIDFRKFEHEPSPNRSLFRDGGIHTADPSQKERAVARAHLYQALRQAILSICNTSRSRLCSVREEIVASLHLDLRSLKLEYKTTCDALRNWPGGPAEEQEFLEYKKQELFRALVEHTFHDEPV